MQLATCVQLGVWSRLMSESKIESAEVAEELRKHGLTVPQIDDVLSVLPDRAIGVLLYGSRARGDYHAQSDIDILALATVPARGRTAGLTNVTTYGTTQFATASGTLFGMHLARDAVIIHDTASELAGRLHAFGPADQEQVFDRVRRLAVALKSDDADRVKYLEGLVRLARYLLRTATYAQALVPGPPCFSVAELAVRFGQPELNMILSSHAKVHGEASSHVLADLLERVEAIVGPIDDNPFCNIQSLIVSEWESDGDLANSTLLVLGDGSASSPYAEIPRVIL